MNMIHVEHAALEQAAQDLVRAARDVQARLDRLEGDLEPLRSDWAGAAKDAYEPAKRTWDEAIAGMISLLTEVARAVEQSNVEYRSADLRNASRFGG